MPRGQFEQVAELVNLLFVLACLVQEFYAVVVTPTVTNESRRANRTAGVRWCELNEDFVFGFKFQTGEDKHAAFTDIVGAALGNAGAVLTAHNQTNRQIKSVALPPSENGSLHCRLHAWVWWCSADAGLRCHNSQILAGACEERKLPKCRTK